MRKQLNQEPVIYSAANTPRAPLNSRKLGINHPRTQLIRAARPHLDWVLKNQLAITSSIILALLLLHHLHPQSRIYTRKLLQLSYYSQENKKYTQGLDDIWFVLAWTIKFTALRAVLIERILQPCSEYLGVKKKLRLRFAEQAWLVLYDGTFWIIGMYLWYNSPYWLNNAELWTAWPAREMSGTFKWYYLVQMAFWTQQIIVIHIEKQRKDYSQMLTHHIITCTLIAITYIYRYTRAANVVLCLMDLVDFLLPIAKILKYLRYETACNIAFGFFGVAWFFTRHIIYLKLCYDIYTDVPGPTTMLYGCYNGSTSELIEDMPAHPDYIFHLLRPFQHLDGSICLNVEVKYIFLGMLLMLQALALTWFAMILKVVYGIMIGGKANDVRSDNEVESDEEVNLEQKRLMNITDLNSCVSSGIAERQCELGEGTTKSPKTVVTTAKEAYRHTENRKKLLSRIGCEKSI